MFAQLKPLIDIRPLTLTVASMPGGKIRLCVVPQSLDKDKSANSKIGYAQKAEVAEIPDAAIKALTLPLALTGTPEELDANLAELLTSYTVKQVELQETFDQACKEIAAAVDAIKQRDKNKQKGKKVPPAKASTLDDDEDDGDSTGEPKTEGEKKGDKEELPLFLCQQPPAAAGASQPAVPIVEGVKN